MHNSLKRFCWLSGVLVLLVVAVAWLHLARRAGNPGGERVRAIWVPRFDYRTPDDVGKIIANLAEAGFTDVFFQIRGNGTAYYKSSVEPWAFELSGDSAALTGTDPGWDPLQLAIDSAKGTGLRVHAYLNVLPGWKGLQDPPAAAGQLWTSHPDWFMVDMLGNRMLPTSGWYAFVNPVLPEVRAHLCDIVRELARYDVDGIHLDYIRYPFDYKLVAQQRYPDASKDELAQHAEFSYDPTSLAIMADLFGADIAKEEIIRFRCDSITRVVQEISATLRTARPGNRVLSASVMGNPVEGKRYAYQDSGEWIKHGVVDWAVQMNYATKSFDRQLDAMRRAGGRRGFRSTVVVGIYCENDLAEILAQMEKVKDSDSRGIALFSYSLLFDQQHNPTEKGRAILPAIRSFR